MSRSRDRVGKFRAKLNQSKMCYKALLCEEDRAVQINNYYRTNIQIESKNRDDHHLIEFEEIINGKRH